MISIQMLVSRRILIRYQRAPARQVARASAQSPTQKPLNPLVLCAGLKKTYLIHSSLQIGIHQRYPPITSHLGQVTGA